MNITQMFITLTVDGSPMQAYVARPNDGALHPALIVAQEAFGVNAHIRNICDRLALEGYVAIAPELFHRSAEVGFALDYTEFDQAKPHFTLLTDQGTSADLQAAYEFLCNDDRVVTESIGAIGFCLGGRVAFLANMLFPLRAAVSFYAGGMQSVIDRASELHAPHLFIWAGHDKNIPHELVESVITCMKEVGKEYASIEFSDTEHGFHCDQRATYNQHAATEAWALAMRFLANRLK